MNPRADKLACAIAGRLHGKHKSLKRPVTLKLDEKTAPLLYRCDPAESRDAWQGIEYLAAQGVLQIIYDQKQPTNELGLWRKPCLVVEPNSEEKLARIAGISTAIPFETQVLALLTSDSRIHPQAPAALLGTRLSGFELFGAVDAVKRFGDLVDLAQTEPTLFLREAAARTFQSLSKVLDRREDLVAALLGRPCPWLASPIQMSIAVPATTLADTVGKIGAIVFVENLTTFERLGLERSSHPNVAFIYAAGWRGSALRARGKEGRSLYFDQSLSPTERTRLENTLDGVACGINTYFYGDLDFSGMGILASMRASYPGLTAWEPGYLAMLECLEQGNSHLPDHADKLNQTDPGSTGCYFTDAVLLPKLRDAKRFVDQEAVVLPKFVQAALS